MNPYLFRATIVAALGGLLFGFDTAVIAGTTAALTELFQLTPLQLGITVSSALWGTVLGAMFGGWSGDRFGRRDSLRILGVFYLVSALGCAFAWDWYSFLFSRFLGGLAIGASSVLGPMYIAEISPARLRGRLVGLFQFDIVLGILLAYFSNYVIGTLGFGENEWRWKLGIAAAPAAAFLGLLFFIPRSPRWLVKRGLVEEAREVLRLTREGDYEAELAGIVESIDAEHGLADEPLFIRKYRFPVFLAISLAMFNQLSGINAILYYLNDIFAQAGFDKVSSDLQAVALGSANLVFTILAMSVIDKLGRKMLLLIGSVGCALSLGGTAWIFLTGTNKHLLVFMLAGFTASFAFSQGAVIWVYLSEVFPNRVRAKGQSLGSFTHWAMNAIIAQVFPMLAALSQGGPFVFFCGMMVAQFFVVWTLFPETKGHTLEEMQKKLGIH